MTSRSKPKKTAPTKKAAPAKKTTRAKKTTPIKKTVARAPHGEVQVVRKGSSTAIRNAVSPTTSAMFDFLCDNRWHTRAEVVAVGAKTCAEEEKTKALKVGERLRKSKKVTREEKIASGASSIARNNLMIAIRQRRLSVDKSGDKVRMSAATAREWRRSRSRVAKATCADDTAKPRQFFGEEQEFGGWLEFDAWALAPLVERDVAYVRPHVAFDTSLLTAEHPDWEVAVAPDGLVTVMAPTGTPVKQLVADWLDQQGIFHEGVRDANGVKRRNLNDLPPEFVDALVRKYTPYAMRRIRGRHYMAMQRLTGDVDDIEGEVALWVVEAIADFNPHHGSPFGAWLTNSLANRVGDLSRAANGRTAADTEMKWARAREKFEAQHGRPPTREEMRTVLGLTNEEMRRKERDLAQLRGLRNTGALETGPDVPEVPIVDMSANPEGETMHLETMERVSRALLAASGEWDLETGRPVRLRHLGFLITYLTHWGEWTKGDLTDVSGRTARFVSEEVRAVQLDMASYLDDLKDERTGRPMPTGDIAI